MPNAEELENEQQRTDRKLRLDLRVAAGHQRVRVVAGMAPAPHGRTAHRLEGGDLIEQVVHPGRPEGGAVPGLVPARIRRPAIEGAVEQEGGNGPRPPEREIGKTACAEDE